MTWIDVDKVRIKYDHTIKTKRQRKTNWRCKRIPCTITMGTCNSRSFARALPNRPPDYPLEVWLVYSPQYFLITVLLSCDFLLESFCLNVLINALTECECKQHERLWYLCNIISWIPNLLNSTYQKQQIVSTVVTAPMNHAKFSANAKCVQSFALPVTVQTESSRGR